ncbi:MAG TPA: hypothetical protein VFW08_03910 [bacterium]|nr:hypothetical protein [bacterium]
MNELGVVYLVLGLLALFVIVGALLPRYLPRLVRRLDAVGTKGPRNGPPDH